MTLIYWLIRLLIIIMVVRMVVRLFTRGAAPRQRVRQSTRTPERIGGTLVRDPQCGTYVTQEKAIAEGSGSGTAYFCSTTCRDAWLGARRA